MRIKPFLLALEANQSQLFLDPITYCDDILNLAGQSGPQDSRLSRVRKDSRIVKAQGEGPKFGRRRDAGLLDLHDTLFIDLAEEIQRQMQVFRFSPTDVGAGAPQLGLQGRERSFDLVWNFDGDKSSHEFGSVEAGKRRLCIDYATPYF